MIGVVVTKMLNPKTEMKIDGTDCFKHDGYCSPVAIGCKEGYYMYGDSQMGCEKAGYFRKGANLYAYYCCLPLRTINITGGVNETARNN